MTDNEIIKALECCANTTVKESTTACLDCCFCPHEDCTSMMADEAHQLINRQMAEIERLNTNMDSMVAEQQRLVKQFKSEAIREFAEELKSEIINDTAYGCDSNQYSGYYDYTIKIGDIPEYIDNLVKRMVGEE